MYISVSDWGSPELDFMLYDFMNLILCFLVHVNFKICTLLLLYIDICILYFCPIVSIVYISVSDWGSPQLEFML